MELKSLSSFWSKRLSILTLGMLSFLGAWAQNPTSLTYPTPNVYIANVNNIFLSPNVAGNVVTYSINPSTLPAGVSFNTNTGIISGTPTAAFGPVVYTVTANGSTGNTTANLSLQVTNNFFNNNYAAVSFSTSTAVRGDGTHVGDTILYTGVATPSGQSIDAFVITQELNNVGSFNAYDQAAVSGGGYSGNSPAYFSPQVNFSGPGSIVFNFQFILGGSFNTTTKTGAQAVTLQNVKVNAYDIDGNGTLKSNQFAAFGDFDSSEVGSGTILSSSYDATRNLTKFRSNISTNSVPLTADSTRVRVTCNNISNFSIALGTDTSGLAYYVVDFSSGPAFNTAVKSLAPSLDLNTSLPGVNNVSTGCNALQAFTGGSGQTNVVMPAGSVLNELDVSFDNSTTNIPNGAGERIVIAGGTPAASDTLLLDTTPGTSTVTVGATTYLVTKTVNAGITFYSFTNNAGGTFPLAQAELLIDALRYTNTALLPKQGNRNFTVNVRNSSFKSPDAIFTPSITCVTISGNIWIDNNAQTNTLVDSSSRIGQLAANGAYAVLVNPTTNAVIAVQGVSAGGAYNFGKQSRGTYNIIIRNSAPTIGSTVTAATYPSGTSGTYISTSENLGLAAGNDLLTDGILKVTVGSESITNANFGIELPPVTANTTYNSVPNPGSYNNYTIPNGGFNATDEDGTVSSITITSFPSGANYLQIGSTIYTSTGSTCPPQSTCTPWPGTVTVTFSGGNPTQAISVDPLSNSTTSVAIPFTSTDNGGVVSNGSSVTVNFSSISTFTVSGNVWNDANGNGSLDGAETLTAAANAGQTLYAYLVQTTNTYSGAGTIYASTPVSASTGYSFANIPAGNNYEVRIVSATTAPLEGALASSVTPALATGYTAVSTTTGGVPTTGLNSSNPVITLNNLTSSKVNNNFGIERSAVSNNFTAVKQVNQGTATPITVPAGAFSATDAEDAPAGYSGNLAGRTVVLNPATSGTVRYNGSPITITTSIPNFDPTLVTILPPSAGAATATFTYSVADNAGLISAASTVNIPLDATSVAISGIVWDDINGDAVRTPATEPLTGAGTLYALLADTLGNVLQTVLVNNTTGAFSFDRGVGSQPYNVILSTTNAAVGAKATTSSLPGNWVNTGTNLSTTANATSPSGIARITTPASGSLTAQNFGIEQRAVADAKTFAISGNATGPLTRATVASTASSGGTYNFRIAVSGTASSGATPGVLTGIDADGSNGSSLPIGDGTPLKLSINPASYTALNASGNPVANGIMLMYNGVQLQPGGCQGADAGTICTYYNSTTGAWEIPNYNASLLTVLVKTGIKSQSFQYSFIDAANKQGALATYSITSSVPLPVDLISFTANAQTEGVALDWQVANEQNMAGYTIERSADAKSFSAINKVAANNVKTTDEYHIIDNAPLNGANYYRLKMEENDGSYKYSNVEMVQMSNVPGNKISIYPNPVVTGTSFTVHTTVAASGSVVIMDPAGKVLYTQPLDHAADTKVNAGNLPAGIYMIAISADGRTQFTKLVVQ